MAACRTLPSAPVRSRAGGWWCRRRRAGRLRLHCRLVGRRRRAGAHEQPGQPGGCQHAPGAAGAAMEASLPDFAIAERRSYEGQPARVGGAPFAAALRGGPARRAGSSGGRSAGVRGGGGPAVDLSPVAGRTAIRSGRTQAEAAVDVLHGPEEHIGDPWDGLGDNVPMGTAVVLDSLKTNEAMPEARTPPPLGTV